MPLGLGITLTILEGGLSYHGNLGIPLEGALGLGVLTVRDWLVEMGKACLAGVGSPCLQEVESLSGGDLSTSWTVVQTCGAECCPQRIAFVYMYLSGKKVMNGKKKVMNGTVGGWSCRSGPAGPSGPQLPTPPRPHSCR